MEAKPMDAPVETEAQLLEAAAEYLLGNYRPQKVLMARGQGCELFDTEGRRYLDFCAGVAVCALGHNHPDLTAAIAEQAARVMQVSNYYYNEQNVLLARELCQATGYDRAFFCNSGTEANEAMLKLARRHFHELGAPRTRIIGFEKAFHGRTMGALALTGNPKYMVGFGPHVSDVDHVPYGDLDAVAAAMGPDVAGIIVEPLQGEGGVNLPPEGFLAGLRALADEHGALLLVDEIQSGIGRTGFVLAMEAAGVEGDATSLAKGLGGGFPIGALVLRQKLAGGLPPGGHGSTFGGNPLACAAARAVLTAITAPGFLATVRERGAYLSKRLAELAARHPNLCEGERGAGLLRAVVLTGVVAPRDMITPMRERGLLITAAGAHGLRFTPPLIVEEASIDEAIALADDGLAALDRG
jgi:acetylornithine/N-succinyldiaminopimelate aminotransferase